MGRDYVRPVGEHDVVLFPGTIEKGINLELILGPGKVCEKLVAYVEAKPLSRTRQRGYASCRPQLWDLRS